MFYCVNEIIVNICLLFALLIHAEDLGDDQELQKENKICFNQTGCFSMRFPWNSLWGYLPQDPKILDIKYFVSTRERAERRKLVLSNLKVLNLAKPLVLIVHGFGGSADLAWVRKLESAFLHRENVNIITIDWEKGASGPNYFQAIANLRVVAAEISRMLNQIVNHRKGRYNDIHLVGQSLGAQLISYVRINKNKRVPRITGLDPAQPWFANKPTKIKLDKSDADFVVVIHTNGKPFWPNLGLGIAEPAGDVDFYMNGGNTQPGCMKSQKGIYDFASNQINTVLNSLACSHRRAAEYLIEALESTCSFWGIRWNINESQPMPTLDICSLDNCQEMGKYTKFLPARGTFYVKTNDVPPYCGVYFPPNFNILHHMYNHINEAYHNLEDILDKNINDNNFENDQNNFLE